MKGKKLLRIDLEELQLAMEDHSYEHEYYLDLETGEIWFLSEYMDDEEQVKLRKKIDGVPDRYRSIPKAESSEGYGDMEDFIGTVNDEHLAELLSVAISGKGAFRRFKDVLFRFSEERERWFKFYNDKARERALEWLEDINVGLTEE
jgi:hypothetical protein